MKVIQPFQLSFKGSTLLSEVVLFTFPILIYILALIAPISSSLGFTLRYADLIVMIPVVGIIYLAYRFPKQWTWFFGLSAAFTIYGITLAGIWSSGISDFFITAGLLPQTDATAYLSIARGLVHGTDVYIAFLRPFSSFFLAGLLIFTQQNLQLAIAIIVGIVALSTFLISWEVKLTHGALPGAITFTGLFIYYRSYLGTLMTEGLGLALGCLALAILWRGAVKLKRGIVILGFSVLTFALLVRTGAVFVLPFTLIWAGFIFAKQSKKDFLIFISIGILTILGAGLYNSTISNYIGSDHVASFGNYSYTLYGLLKGGNWMLAYTEHPEIVQNSELQNSEKVALIYQLSFDIIRQNPMSLAFGVMRAWTSFFKDGISLLFSEFHLQGFTSPSLKIAISWLFRPLLALGLLGCLYFWRNPLYSLVLAMVAGIFLSTALAPIWDTGLRAYAVSVVVGYVLLALGFWFFLQFCLWCLYHIRKPLWLVSPLKHLLSNAVASPSTNEPITRYSQKDYSIQMALWLSIALVFFSAVFPLLIKLYVPKVQFQSASCPASQEGIVVYYHPRSTVNLISDDLLTRSKAPNLRISDFRSGLWFLNNFKPTMGNLLASLQPGESIISVKSPDHIVVPTAILPDKPGHYTVCGKRKNTKNDPAIGLDYNIFSAQSIKPAKAIPVS